MKEILIDELKQIQLQIMDAVHEFCVKNSIQYFLAGGTLIGAIRHNGYIPWDDDIDIIMYRDDYERFIGAFNAAQSRYHALSIENDTGYNYHFCKVEDTKTVLDESNIGVNDITIGINIDIFPLDKYPNTNAESIIHKQLHELDLKMYCKSFRMNRIKFKPFKQRLLIIAYKIKCLFTTKRKLGLMQLQIAKQYSNIETSLYAPITCHVGKEFPIIDRNSNKQVEHPFEDRTYMIPSVYDNYLKAIFGDYMTPPPQNQQRSGHTFKAYWKE